MAFKSLTNQNNVTKLPATPYKSASYKSPAPLFDTLSPLEWEEAVDYAATFAAPYNRLVDIHSYCRPHGSKTIDDFVEKFLMFYPSAEILTTELGVKMAVRIVTDPTSKTMFSSHVDTVHGYAGRQLLSFDQEMGLLIKPTSDRAYGDCLGADDGAGIWLLLEMIDAGVPGTYLFHYGEERGGIGSSLMAKEMPDYLRTFDRAVAFDRKGTADIITYQGASRCCSDEFANALAEALNGTEQGLTMAADDGGIFTDTANYTTLIPECTNIACGYEFAHTKDEYLDTDYLTRLRNALLVVDWETLPTSRDPKAVDDLYGTPWGRWDMDFDQSPKKSLKTVDPIEELTNCVQDMRFKDLIEFVKTTSADDVAEVIYELTDRIFSLQERVFDLESEQFDNLPHPTASFDEDDDGDDDLMHEVGVR